MRFLADMGVSMSVVDWLRTQQHDVVHLREEGLQRLPNGLIFAKAHSERRTVITFDLDFGEILASSKDSQTSVVLFRLNNTASQFVIQRLAAVLGEAQEALEQGAIVVVEDGRYRVRRLPLGA